LERPWRVQRELVVRVPGTEPAARAVEGPITLGGSRADGILVPGLPPAALRLEPCAAGLVLCPAAPGLHVAGRAVAPGGRRLLQPGEHASLRPVTLELRLEPTVGPPPARPESTRLEAAAVLRGALSDSTLQPAPPGPHLVVLTGRDAGARVPISSEVLIGRGRGADLRLDDRTISRRHARLRLGPGGAVLEDLGAKNRLRVNGVPAERRPVPIRPGDRITLGETELAFHDRTAPSIPDGGARAPPARAGRVTAAAGLRPLLVAALLAFSAAALALASSLG
jgi:hypothetical protein